MIDRKKRAKELEDLIGEFIQIRLKTMDLIDMSDPDNPALLPIEGYVAQVSENYLYIGDLPNEYTSLIELDEIRMINIIDSLPEELKEIVDGESVH